MVVEELRTSKVKGDLRGMAAAIIAQLHSEDDTASVAPATSATHKTSGAAHNSGNSERAKKKQREVESTGGESDTSEGSSTEHSGVEDTNDRTTLGRAQKRQRQEDIFEEEEGEEEEDEEDEDEEEDEQSGGPSACWDLLGCGGLVPNTSVSELLHHWRLSAADIWIPRVWGLHDAEEFHSILLHRKDVAPADAQEAPEAEDELDVWSDLERVKLGDCVWVQAPALTSATMGRVYAIYTLPGRRVPLVDVFDPVGDQGMTLTVEDVRAMSEDERDAQKVDNTRPDSALMEWLHNGGDVMRTRAIIEWDVLDADQRRVFMRSALQCVLQADATAHHKNASSTDVGAAREQPREPPRVRPEPQPQAQPEKEGEEDEEEKAAAGATKREKEEKTEENDGTELVSQELVQDFLQTQKELLSQIMALCRQLSPDGTILFS